MVLGIGPYVVKMPDQKIFFPWRKPFGNQGYASNPIELQEENDSLLVMK
jgi:hypothetical protein